MQRYRSSAPEPVSAFSWLAASKIAGLYLRSQGFAPEAAVEWAPISLQDETEEATARLTRAKAEELERKLAHEAKQEGTA